MGGFNSRIEETKDHFSDLGNRVKSKQTPIQTAIEKKKINKQVQFI